MLSASSVPMYVATLLAVLGGLAVAFGTPAPWFVRPVLVAAGIVPVGAFALPFARSASLAFQDEVAGWVQEAEWARRHRGDRRRWIPTGGELLRRRKFLRFAWALGALLFLVGCGIWVGDRLAVGQAALLSVLSFAVCGALTVGMYLRFERRWATKADLQWQIARVEQGIEAWDARLQAPLGFRLPERMPDTWLVAAFGVFLWLAFFSFLGEQTGAGAMALLAFPAWATAVVAFLFGRDPSRSGVF